MATTQKISAGYKQTEIGVIPADWDVKELRTVTHFENGKAHEGHISDGGEYIVINSKFISSEGGVVKYSTKNFSPANAGDIALVMSDIPNGKALAKCYLVKQDGKFALNQRICSLRADGVDNVFLFYMLNRNNYFLQFDNGVSQTNLRKDDVLSCPLSIPQSREEQTAVVTALNDIEVLIISLEKLLAKKRAIKQGAMQELLTGKRHLPGFSGKWETKKLGDVVERFQNGFAFPAKHYVSDGMPIVTMAQIGLDGLFHFDEKEVNFWPMSEAERLKSYWLNDGDVIIAMTDVTPDKNLVGRMTIVKTNRTLLLNQRVGMLKINTDKVNAYFLTALSNMRMWRDYSKATASLGVQANMSTKDILFGQIYIPRVEEQDAITQVLTDIDKEIKQQEQKLAKYQMLKQGMMQVLLTGKVRLI